MAPASRAEGRQDRPAASGPWRLRAAEPADAGPLSRLAERTFREAFADLNSPADIDLHCARNFTPELQLAEIGDPDTFTLLAECGQELVAYAQVRRGAPPPCVAAASPAELSRIYVQARWQGSGLATELMARVVDQARLGGGDVLWLGVWERNPRAIRFYRRCGFSEVGEQPFLLGTDRQRDLVLALPLGAAEGGP